MQYNLVSRTPGDLMQYNLSLVEHQGTLYSILSLVRTPGDLYSILSLVEHQGTLYNTPGDRRDLSSYPKFVLKGFEGDRNSVGITRNSIAVFY